MPFGAATKSDPALSRPGLNLLNATYLNKKSVTNMWNVAGGAPLLLKKSSKQRKLINKKTGKVTHGARK